MTCMFSVCTTTTHPSGAPAVSTVHLEDHLQVTVACRLTAHTQPASTASHSWRVPDLRHTPCHTMEQCGLLGSHQKDVSRAPGGTCEAAGLAEDQS